MPIGVLGQIQFSDQGIPETFREHFPLRRGIAGSDEVLSRITLLDTFDWRLFRSGKIFEASLGDDGAVFHALRDIRGDGGAVRVPGGTTRLPRFPSDIPDEGLKRTVESIIDVRALLPQAQLEHRRERLGDYGESGESFLKLYRDRYSVTDEQGMAQEICSRISVESVPQSGKSARRLLEQSVALLAGQPDTGEVWLYALRVLGRSPQTEPAETPRLSPELRADLAMKQFLLPLAATMRSNEQGLLARVDTEFLHDFRVAVRRSRSALSQLKGVFPTRVIARYVRDLAWLGQNTGLSRDLDVYLLEFDRLRDLLPAFMQGDLAPLRELLERSAAEAHARLVKLLRQRRYREFVDDWTAFLQKPVPARPSAPVALTPIGPLLARRIFKLHRRIARRDDWQGPRAEAAAIHELRKTCKKLRYLLEFAQSSHPPDKLRRSIKDLRVLQNHLGAFQDADVQIAHLRQWAEELDTRRQVPVRTLLAIGALIGRLDQLQQQRRGHIPDALREFGKKGNRRRIRQLLGET